MAEQKKKRTRRGSTLMSGKRKHPLMTLGGVPPEMKASWYEAAERAGKTWADWARDLMCAASGYRPDVPKKDRQDD